MLFKLFIAFTMIPVIEIFLLVQISSILGPLVTILLVIATGFLGANLAKIQGAQTFIRIRENMDQGIMPGDEVLDAFLILVAGILLITPGILTDIAGLLLLVPNTRQGAKAFLKREFDKRIKSGSIRIRKL